MEKNVIIWTAFIFLFVSCEKPCNNETISINLPNLLFTDISGIHNRLNSDSGLSSEYSRSAYTSGAYETIKNCKQVYHEKRSYIFNSHYLNGTMNIYYLKDSVVFSILPDDKHEFRYCLSHNVNMKGQINNGWGKPMSDLDSKISLDTLINYNGFPTLLKFTVDEFGFLPTKSYIKEYYIEPTKGITNARTLDNIYWSFE